MNLFCFDVKIAAPESLGEEDRRVLGASSEEAVSFGRRCLGTMSISEALVSTQGEALKCVVLLDTNAENVMHAVCGEEVEDSIVFGVHLADASGLSASLLRQLPHAVYERFLLTNPPIREISPYPDDARKALRDFGTDELLTPEALLRHASIWSPLPFALETTTAHDVAVHLLQSLALPDALLVWQRSMILAKTAKMDRSTAQTLVRAFALLRVARTEKPRATNFLYDSIGRYLHDSRSHTRYWLDTRHDARLLDLREDTLKDRMRKASEEVREAFRSPPQPPHLVVVVDPRSRMSAVFSSLPFPGKDSSTQRALMEKAEELVTSQLHPRHGTELLLAGRDGETLSCIFQQQS